MYTFNMKHQQSVCVCAPSAQCGSILFQLREKSQQNLHLNQIRSAFFDTTFSQMLFHITWNEKKIIYLALPHVETKNELNIWLIHWRIAFEIPLNWSNLRNKLISHGVLQDCCSKNEPTEKSEGIAQTNFRCILKIVRVTWYTHNHPSL